MLTSKQKKALKYMNQGLNVFITGPGGTGKSFLINTFVNNILKIIEKKELSITSTTGLSSMLINGRTINSFAGIGLADKSFEYYFDKIKKNYNQKKNWIDTKILIIDEVSMLSPRIFELLDALGRRIRKINKPFGGIQIILFGDFCQLPCVGESSFCFEAVNWDICIHKTVYLTEILRQSDKIFQNVLNKIRLGICDDEVKLILSSRLNKKLKNEDGIIPTILYPKKKAVINYNKKKLKQLLDKKIKSITYIAKYEYSKNCSINYRQFLKDLMDKNSKIEDELILTVKSQVMINKNIPDLKLANGSRGIVIGFSNDNFPIIKFLDNREIIIKQQEWDFSIDKTNFIKKKQLPLVLAWALTIHKSQGMSLDYVKTSIGESIFEYGQVYVVLSRVKNLEGLTLENINFNKIRAHPRVKEYYSII